MTPPGRAVPTFADVAVPGASLLRRRSKRHRGAGPADPWRGVAVWACREARALEQEASSADPVERASIEARLDVLVRRLGRLEGAAPDEDLRTAAAVTRDRARCLATALGDDAGERAAFDESVHELAWAVECAW